MSELRNVLRYTMAKGNQSRKSLMDDKFFVQSMKNITCKDLTSDRGERITGYKALLQSEGQAIAESTIVQEQVMETIRQGARAALCFEECIPEYVSNSYQVRAVKGSTSLSYASEVAEGAMIPIDTESFTVDTKKLHNFKCRSVITEELISDGLVDIISSEISRMGSMISNAINRDCLNEILNGTDKVTTSLISAAGTHISVSDVARAVSLVKKYHWQKPNVLVTHPVAEGYLLQDSNLVYVSYSTGSSFLKDGKISGFMGLTPYSVSATDRATAPIWDDTTPGTDVTALVFSNQDFMVLLSDGLGMTLQDYKDPISDLRGFTLKKRVRPQIFFESACAAILHK